MNQQQRESSETDTSNESENQIYESESSEDLNQLNNNNNNNTLSDIELIRKLVDLKLKYELDTVKLKKHLKIIKSKMDEINKQLIILMKKQEATHININNEKGGGKIKYKKTKSYSSISKKCLNNLLPIFFKQYNINIDTNELIKFLYQNREFKELEKLTKTK
tara:strand:+ start:941 stop:1429 length:489 start_codon:yes stop_codon:yes gene_type:complete